MGGASLAGLQDHLKLVRKYALEGLYFHYLLRWRDCSDQQVIPLSLCHFLGLCLVIFIFLENVGIW